MKIFLLRKYPDLRNIPYSLKFSRIKYFTVLPNSAQKQIFTDKIFTVKFPAMHCVSFELEISREKVFVAILWPAKSAKILGYNNYGNIDTMSCMHSYTIEHSWALSILYLLWWAMFSLMSTLPEDSVLKPYLLKWDPYSERRVHRVGNVTYLLPSQHAKGSGLTTVCFHKAVV